MDKDQIDSKIVDDAVVRCEGLNVVTIEADVVEEPRCVDIHVLSIVVGDGALHVVDGSSNSNSDAFELNFDEREIVLDRESSDDAHHAKTSFILCEISFARPRVFKEVDRNLLLKCIDDGDNMNIQNDNWLCNRFDLCERECGLVDSKEIKDYTIEELANLMT